MNIPAHKTVYRTILLACLLLIISALYRPLSISGQDREIPRQTILIRNVIMTLEEGENDDVVVNLILKNGDLNLVTRNTISIDDADHAYDARKGVLVGVLELGQPASFMILNKDPREDPQVMTDTKTHSLFVILDGHISKNVLYSILYDDTPTVTSGGWFSYAPPPTSLPLDYRISRPWNMFKTKAVSGLFSAAVVLDRNDWVAQDDNNISQVGDLNDYSEGTIRGLRFGAVGTFNFKNPWTYVIFGATQAFDRGFEQDSSQNYQLFDYRLDIPIGPVTVSIGKQKEPISHERVQSMLYNQMQERSSISDGMLASRNTGIVFSGMMLDKRMSLAGGVFNSWYERGVKLSESATQFIARVTGLPFMSSDESNILHLAGGLRYSTGKEGLRYKAKSEINNSPLHLDTDLIPTEGFLTYSLEFGYRRGPLLLLAETVRSQVNSPTLSDPVFGGYYLSTSYILTGEMHTYLKRSGIFNIAPVSTSVNQGGWGLWELSARWSSLDLNSDPVLGGKMNTFSLGLNWWLNPSFLFNINYRYTILDNYGLIGTNHGIVTRVVLTL